MHKSHLKRAKKILRAGKNEFLFFKLLLECWNAETPHFGGDGPHRYDDNSKLCGYCDRPKNWKPGNAGYYASELAYGNKL